MRKILFHNLNAFVSVVFDGAKSLRTIRIGAQLSKIVCNKIKIQMCHASNKSLYSLDFWNAASPTFFETFGKKNLKIVSFWKDNFQVFSLKQK